MLRIGMRALQRAAALQLQQGACSASSAGSGLLSALAAAMQRLQGPQHTSWASSQHNGSRQFAAAVGGGGASSGGGGSSGGREDALMSPMLASESGRLQFSDPDEALEAWGKAMDEGARPVVALRAAASRRRRMRRRRRRRCVHALPPLPPTVPLLLLPRCCCAATGNARGAVGEADRRARPLLWRGQAQDERGAGVGEAGDGADAGQPPALRPILPRPAAP